MPKTPSLGRRMAVEALGVFLLVLLGGGAIISSSYFFSGSGQLLLIAIAHGLALGLAVTIAMNISGGHINPAVTIAMLVTKRIKAFDAGAYIVAQVIGGAIGAALLLIMVPSIIAAGTNLGAPALASGVSVFQGIAIEAAITFVLVMGVFATCVDKRGPKIGGFGVGLALAVGILFAGPLTGAAANPARALGPELIISNFSNWYVYWIGPILGAVIAALIYEHFVLRKN